MCPKTTTLIPSSHDHHKGQNPDGGDLTADCLIMQTFAITGLFKQHSGVVTEPRQLWLQSQVFALKLWLQYQPMSGIKYSWFGHGKITAHPRQA